MPTPITRLGLLPDVNRQLEEIGIKTCEDFAARIDDGQANDLMDRIGLDNEELLELIEEVNEIAPLKRGILVHHLSPEEQAGINEIDVEGTAKVNAQIQNAVRRMDTTERKRLAQSMVEPVRGARRKT